jgi:hypothetical protein
MFTEKLILEASQQGLQAVIKWAEQNVPTEELVYDNTEESLYKHYSFVKNWCQEVRLFDMPKPRALTDLFVEPTLSEGLPPLTLQSMPRTSRIPVHYRVFLKPGTHRVLFGHPGAGKTTLVQRLCGSLIFGDTPDATDSEYEFPLLFRLRTASKGRTLTATLLSLLGLQLNSKVAEKTLPKTNGEGFWHWDELEQQVLVAFLNTRCVLILLDGFDELHPALRSAFSKELGELTYRIERSDFFITSRSATAIGTLGRTEYFSILPFDASGIKVFARGWFSDGLVCDRFLEELDRTPYRDATVRPLTLATLCLLYDKYGEIPSPPSEVYRRLVNMYLEKWDEHRNIRRVSKYGRFGPERKREFLGLLAYTMARAGKGPEFAHSDLEEAYRQVNDRFDLPPSDSERVLSEIESHTGLLVEAGFSTYAFYHKSIQEFLCAEVIARLPLLPRRVKHLFRMPDECAIAAALTGDISSFIAVLLNGFADSGQTKGHGNHTIQGPGPFWIPFFERCRVEEVRFAADPVMAHCILAIESLGWHKRKQVGVGEDEYYPDENHNELLKRLESVVSQKPMQQVMQNIWRGGSVRQRESYSVSTIALPQDVFGRFPCISGITVVDNRLLRAFGRQATED